MGSLLLIAIFLFTYESHPGFELAPVTENTLELWDPQKLILNNDKADELVKKGYLLVAESSKYMGPLAKASRYPTSNRPIEQPQDSISRSCYRSSP